MNHPLKPIVDTLKKQCQILGKARDEYLAMEATRKYFEGNLIKNAPGKSHAERVNHAQSTNESLEFHKGLARLEAAFKFHELKFQVLEKEYQAQYLALKLDAGMISKET